MNFDGPMSRRRCLGGLSAAAALSFAPRVFSIEPLKRQGPSLLRVGLAAYSFRNYLQNKAEPPMDLFGFVDWCHEHRIRGAELTSYYFPADVDEEYLLKLKRHCHLAGVTVTGGAIGNDFCTDDPKKLRQAIDQCKQWVDRYAILGAPVIRIFAGKVPEGGDKDETIERCAKATQEACDYAADRGVMLALENHGGITAYAEDLLRIVEKVDSPAFGVNFDSGNFRSTADPYAELAMIAPYAINAQVKVEMYVAGEHEMADLPRIIRILRDADYSGWVVLEHEAKEDPIEHVPQWIEKLEKAIEETA